MIHKSKTAGFQSFAKFTSHKTKCTKVSEKGTAIYNLLYGICKII